MSADISDDGVVLSIILRPDDCSYELPMLLCKVRKTWGSKIPSMAGAIAFVQRMKDVEWSQVAFEVIEL